MSRSCIILIVFEVCFYHLSIAALTRVDTRGEDKEKYEKQEEAILLFVQPSPIWDPSTPHARIHALTQEWNAEDSVALAGGDSEMMHVFTNGF